MNTISKPPLEEQVRAILSPDKAGALLSLWERCVSLDDGGEADELLIATVLMLGSDRPSPAAALSVAQGLYGSTAGAALAYLGGALSALSGAGPISPAYRAITASGVLAAAEALQSCSRSIGAYPGSVLPE
jgi:hypothetical protein